MPAWWKRLTARLGRGEAEPLDQEKARELAGLFKRRYHEFRGLLTANNQALEQMAKLSLALSQKRPEGLAFLQGVATSAGVKAFAMARHLAVLAPGRYSALFDRLQEILGDISAELAPPVDDQATPLVLTLAGITADFRDQAGPKMANLAEAARLGLAVPPGFVVTARAWRAFMAHSGLQQEIDRLLQSHADNEGPELFTLASRLQQMVVAAELPPELEEALARGYAELSAQAGQGVRVALRSSALGEDEAGASFAGQYKSLLNLSADFLAASYKEVVASKYSARAITYRRRHGLADPDLPICVGCLAMVPAVAGGVVYTANPLDPEDKDVRISAAWGLPKAVVDGDAPADQVVISRGAPHRVLSYRLAEKTAMFVCREDDGVCRLETERDRADQPALSGDQAAEAARAALALEDHFGVPQDVEWAREQSGRLVILQSRPIFAPAAQAREGAPEPRGELLLSAGETVSPGVGGGKVFWVRKDADLLRFPKGAVLAVEHPWPRWAALLGQSAAVVAVTGGLAGHMATVARELGVPAIFGAGQAAEGLRDGMEVTLYADLAQVRAGRGGTATARVAPPAPAGPLLGRMQRVARRITPLTMLNPDSPDFIPENCRTLHDVTRFCHEKAVAEMFSFGERQGFPQLAAKQLFYQVPMQYWVLNLSDGFRREVDGKYVKMEEIACQPMLALWEGLVAIPWEGPPAMNGRGFASVMFQATANPALASPTRQPYAEKNYFMISGQFMNLQSRFGFHLAWVEALMSDRPSENYLAFSFSGGAADEGRRAARAVMVGELLSGRGFRVELKGDTVRCRLEGRDKKALRREVKAAGYLLMHTRQLDMAMGDPNARAHYRNKLARDLASLERDAEEPERS